jgi:hypothetical protein
MVTIRQPNGSIKRFPESELATAYLDAFERTVGRADPAEPVHPLCAAARNSSEPKWSESFYAAGGVGRTEPIEELYE